MYNINNFILFFFAILRYISFVTVAQAAIACMKMIRSYFLFVICVIEVNVCISGGLKCKDRFSFQGIRFSVCKERAKRKEKAEYQ